MEVTFKECDISDLNKLIQISVATFEDTFAEANTPDDMTSYIDKAFNKDQMKFELLNNASCFFFAYHQQQLIGYFKINFAPSQSDINDHNALELERIYILEAFQGKGFGPTLLRKIIAIGKEKGLRYIWLGVWEKNAKAIHVYEKKGFVPFAKHDFLLGSDLQTDILMKLEL